MAESSRATQVHASILNTVDVNVFNDRISSQLPVAKNHPGPKRVAISSNSRPKTIFRPPISAARKSYTVRYKLQVLAYLHQASIPDGTQSANQLRRPTLVETSHQFKIPVPNISQCKLAESTLLTRVGTERRSRIGKRKWPVLEKELYDAFQAHRKQGKIVRRGFFRIKAKLLFQQYHPNEGVFQFSNGWFNGMVQVKDYVLKS
ncbi:hypothetical protein L873DRAFT_1843505 [Choiromyces venosus 120613-1]|uniref:HTH CENPB-type domain-containing protein n=1 Tax=Choiromyces venosus 120613-1 TaxID=1336337 RepID=A0A3N4JRG3_9PEZI|nr:hypothetical protein L873DRAFT_1843505 [Choiromyces venosus 120613-1]